MSDIIFLEVLITTNDKQLFLFINVSHYKK